MARDRLSSPLGPEPSLGGILIRPPRLEPVADTPEGFSPEQFGTSFPGLESIAADAARLQSQAKLPGVIPEDLPIDEKLAILDRMETIRASVPGIDGAKLLSLAYHHADISSAITAARAEAAAKPRSWWHHVVAPFKAVFVDAPEFVWRKVVVDPFQEFAELVGIDPEVAQRLSPGQVILAGVAQLPGADFGSVENPDGTLRDPEEWEGALRWASGALDLAARLTLDPTLVLGKFRNTLALPGGAEKLLGLTRVYHAGKAARVARLQNIAFGTARGAADVAKAQRIAAEIVSGRRVIKNYLAGYVSLSDIARDAISHSGVRSFVRDAVRAAEDSPDAVAQILRSYGSLRKGFGITVEHADYIADAARRGLAAGRIQGNAFHGGISEVNKAITEMITMTFTPSTTRRLDTLVRDHASTVALRNDALHVIEAFHANRSVDVVDVTLNRRPHINARGRVIAEEIELSQPGHTITPDVGPAQARVEAEAAELSIPGSSIPTPETTRSLERSRAQAEFAEALPEALIDNAPVAGPAHAPLPIQPRGDVADDLWDRLRRSLVEPADATRRIVGPLAKGRKNTVQRFESDIAGIETWVAYDEAGDAVGILSLLLALEGGAPDISIAVRPGARRQGIGRKLATEAMRVHNVSADDLARAVAGQTNVSAMGAALGRALVPVPIEMTFPAYATRRASEGYTGGTKALLDEHATLLNNALRSGRMVPRPVLESTPAYRELLTYAERHGLVADDVTDAGKINHEALVAGVDIEASKSRRAREIASPEFPPPTPGRLPAVPPATGVGEIVPGPSRTIPATVPDTGAGELIPPRPAFTEREIALSEVETGIPADISISRADIDIARSDISRYTQHIRETADKLRPYLNLSELDDDAIAEVVHGWKTIENELHITKPLAEFPYATVFGRAINWLGDSPLRQVPFARNLLPEYLPHRSLNVHDPFWFVQYNRLGRLFGLEPAEIEDYISRARSSGSPFGMRSVTENLIDTGYQRMGITPELVAELKGEAHRRSGKIFAVINGEAVTRPILASDQLNTVWLTDPKFIRLFLRRSKGGSFARMTVAETRAAIIDSLDRYQNIFKRLMIAAPRTGLRVLMETQARALAYGYSSAISDPLAWFDTFVLSVFSPQRALDRLRKSAPGDIADIHLGARDLGMNQLRHESGLLSPRAWGERQVTYYRDVKQTPWQAHQYRKAQAEYINDFLLNDDLARQIIFAPNPDDALRWLRSPAATSYRAVVRVQTSEQIERHFTDVLTIVEQQSLMHPRIRAIATGRPGVPGRAITAEDLVGFEADSIVGANIHGVWAGDNLQEKITRLLDMAVERNLASIEHIGRDYTSRRELHREVWDRVGKLRRAGATIDDETIDVLLRGGAVPKDTSMLERAIVRDSRQSVFARMKWLFFDMAEHSRASEALRFLFPFGNAYQEVVGTWAAILHERPWVPHLGAALAGSVDDLPGLTYTDPATGEKMFRIPLSGHLLRFAGLRAPNPITGLPGELAYEFTGRLEGFNVVTAGFPIPGPYAQFSAWFVNKHKPLPTEVLNTLFPYGLGTFTESVQPGWFREFRNFLDTYLDSDVSDVDLASVAADLGMEEVYSTIKRANALDDPIAARDALATLDDIDERKFLDKLRFLFAIRAASRVFFPAVVRERSPMRDMIEFYRSVSQSDPNFANAVFLARYGPEFLTLVEERTEIVKPNTPPPTKAARERLLTDPALNKLVSVFGQPAWDVLKETWSGELDRDMLRDQIVSGDRRRRTLPEIRQAALSAVGWEYYFLYNDQLERRMASLGIANIQQADATPFRNARSEFISRLRFAFPDWAQEFATGSKRNAPVNISRLSILANVPQLQGLESITGLRKYFALRRNVIRHMQALGLASLDSQSALAIKMGFQDQIREVVREHPAFARLWGRYLVRDDLTPLDQLLLRTGLVDQAGFLREVA